MNLEASARTFAIASVDCCAFDTGKEGKRWITTIDKPKTILPAYETLQPYRRNLFSGQGCGNWRRYRGSGRASLRGRGNFWVGVHRLEVLDAKREAVVFALGDRDGQRLVKRSRAVYWNAEHTYRAVSTISKRYEKKGAAPY